MYGTGSQPSSVTAQLPFFGTQDAEGWQGFDNTPQSSSVEQRGHEPPSPVDGTPTQGLRSVCGCGAQDAAAAPRSSTSINLFIVGSLSVSPWTCSFRDRHARAQGRFA